MVDDMETLEKTSQAFLYFKANFPEQIEALQAFVSCKKMCLLSCQHEDLASLVLQIPHI